MTGQSPTTGPRPDQTDLDRAATTLRESFRPTVRTDVYPFLVGYLEGIIEDLVEVHGNCRRRTCRLCSTLRRAAAILIASKRQAQP
jgi:hypothetical protein